MGGGKSGLFPGTVGSGTNEGKSQYGNYNNQYVQLGSLNDLPTSARDTYYNYEKNGWKGNFNGQTPRTKAGGDYENKPEYLPITDSKGNFITYKEYDVNNRIQGQSRDGERFLVGSDGSIYYTDSHYGDTISPSGLLPFVKIK